MNEQAANLADRWGIHPDHFWLRGREPEAVVRHDEKTGMWNVYGYRETLEILADPETFSSDATRFFPPEALMFADGDLTQTDGDSHRKLRKLVVGAFSPKTVADLEPRIRQIGGELLDAVDADRFEMVGDLAYPMPVIVIAELLGVPVDDRDLFQDMVLKILGISAQIEGGVAEIKVDDAEMEAAQAFYGYMGEQTAKRRKRPREDLLTRLVEAEVDGDRLSDAQVVNFAGLLLAAGFITTTMLLGNTLLCLDAYPEHAARVRADRDEVPAVIEESLRFLSPVAMGIRATSSDVDVAGRRIPKDQLVQVWLSAANRDPRQFDRPHEFDPSRQSNAHLGFGRGVHFCLGAGLARLEGRIALNLVLDRFPKLATDPDDPPTFLELPAFTGPRTLPLRTR
ncbi:MAG: cytochrome P450 [Stackebrandtia sp.]